MKNEIINYIKSGMRMGRHYKDVCLRFNITSEYITQTVPDAIRMPNGFISMAYPRDRIDYLS